MAPGNPATVANSQLLRRTPCPFFSGSSGSRFRSSSSSCSCADAPSREKSPATVGGFFCRAPVATRIIELEFPMAKKAKLLSDLFYDTLKDVYFAENKILKTLPKMARPHKSKDLKAAFVKHERETRGHVKRLQACSKYWVSRR